MKTTIYLKITLFSLFALIQQNAFAVIYDAYVCGQSTTVTLTTNVTLNNETTDVIKWFQVVGGVATPVKTGSHTDRSFTTPTAVTLGEGAHIYRAQVLSANPQACEGEVSDNYDIYVLPFTLTVTLSQDANTSWCQTSTTNNTSAITATAAPTGNTFALPEDVGYSFTWDVTKGGTAVTPGSSVDGTTPFTTSVYTVTTTTPGLYSAKASVSYKVPAGTTLLSGGNASCTVTSSAKTVEVIATPNKPTISIM